MKPLIDPIEMISLFADATFYMGVTVAVLTGLGLATGGISIEGALGGGVVSIILLALAKLLDWH